VIDDESEDADTEDAERAVDLSDDEDIYDPVDETDRVTSGRVTTKPQKLSLGLFLGSNPTRCRRYDEDEIALHRRVLCRRYINCLTWAAAQDWIGWSCDNCDVKDVLSREQQADDLDGLADFLHELNLVGRKRR
jgi:hypothetical protein